MSREHDHLPVLFLEAVALGSTEHTRGGPNLPCFQLWMAGNKLAERCLVVTFLPDQRLNLPLGSKSKEGTTSPPTKNEEEMERSLNWVPFCYKNRAWLVLCPERLSNMFPETGRAAGVASASEQCGPQHRNFKGKFQAGKLRPAGAVAMSPRAQDFTSHQHPPMHERKGNIHSLNSSNKQCQLSKSFLQHP